MEDIPPRHRSTILDVGNVRIDLQGTYPRIGNRRYANIQIQVGSHTYASAQIQIDDDNELIFPIRYVRHALRQSLVDCQNRQCRLERQSQQEQLQ